MPNKPDDPDDNHYAERIRGHLRAQHAKALHLLPKIASAEFRSELAALVAQSWPKQDIDNAWNAVSRSPLNASEKQIMFNELWG